MQAESARHDRDGIERDFAEFDDVPERGYLDNEEQLQPAALGFGRLLLVGADEGRAAVAPTTNHFRRGASPFSPDDDEADAKGLPNLVRRAMGAADAAPDRDDRPGDGKALPNLLRRFINTGDAKEAPLLARRPSRENESSLADASLRVMVGLASQGERWTRAALEKLLLHAAEVDRAGGHDQLMGSSTSTSRTTLPESWPDEAEPWSPGGASSSSFSSRSRAAQTWTVPARPPWAMDDHVDVEALADDMKDLNVVTSSNLHELVANVIDETTGLWCGGQVEGEQDELLRTRTVRNVARNTAFLEQILAAFSTFARGQRWDPEPCSGRRDVLKNLCREVLILFATCGSRKAVELLLEHAAREYASPSSPKLVSSCDRAFGLDGLKEVVCAWKHEKDETRPGVRHAVLDRTTIQRAADLLGTRFLCPENDVDDQVGKPLPLLPQLAHTRVVSNWLTPRVSRWPCRSQSRLPVGGTDGSPTASEPMEQVVPFGFDEGTAVRLQLPSYSNPGDGRDRFGPLPPSVADLRERCGMILRDMEQ
eukprot:g16771.t1